MSSPDINYPAQPSYGEGMADAMKAQMEQLLGQGDYADIYSDAGFEGGNLGDILAGVEAPIRQQTAQIDTDVLRQTILGNQSKVQVERDPKTGNFGIPNAEQVDLGGEPGEYDRYNLFLVEEGSIEKDGGHNRGKGFGTDRVTSPQYVLVDNKTGGVKKYGGEDQYIYKTESEGLLEDLSRDVLKIGQDAQVEAMESIGEEGREFTFEDPYTGELLQEGDVITIRDEDGMIDLLGDKRQVQGQVPDYEAYVRGREDLTQQYDDVVRGGDTRSMEEFGRDHYEAFGKKEGASIPTKFGDTDRQAGFDEQGNFLGLSALAEDIQAGNLSRQRERDLADVERLSGRFQDVMEDYKPGTAEAVTGAREVLESQKDRLTGEGQITKPTADTYGGAATPATMTAATLGLGPTLDAKTSYDALDPLTRQTLTADTTYDPSASVSGGSYTAAQAANPMALTAATSYDPSAGVTGEGYTATAGLEGGQIEADALRNALMADAEAALGQGLTDREQRQIAEASRARSTMMGRTFDQSAGIAEAEARVQEDNARKMQNRAFAQRTLGQEAGLQESDLGRGLQASMQNQAALNRAAEFGAGQDMQAQLANQAATNQARQAGMTAGLSQEALAAQQQQAKEFANMQAQNRALEFGQTQGMQAQLANQQAQNQALQFGAQAGMAQEQAESGLAQQAGLAEFAGEQARRQTGMQAGMQQDLAQAGIQQERDALQAQLNQQGAAFGAEAQQQAALADQRQKQQAKQFGVGATMDAERLNAQLAQQGALGYVDAATRLAALEDQTMMDPFSLLRAGGGSLQAGQGVFGQAGYGLSSGPQYLNPESGLGYISQMAANEASMYGAQQMANASRSSGLMGGLGSLFGGAAGGLLGNTNLFK